MTQDPFTNMTPGWPSGIDVSHYQGEVDWATVAEVGIVFAFAKATEGISVVDSQFATNWAGMQQAGLLRGAYHFFRPAQDAHRQAENFVNQFANPLALGDLPPVLDVEDLDGVEVDQVLDRAEIWMRDVQVALGCRPILYTNRPFWRNTMGNSTRLADYYLWLAHYTSAPEPRVTGGWDSWVFWQYSPQGTIPGVAGAVDLDYFNGQIDQLRRLVTFA